MGARVQRYIKFQAIFWLVIAVALFLYGLRYGHTEVAVFRNMYVFLLGILLSTLLGRLYGALAKGDDLQKYAVSGIGILLASIVMSSTVNPITLGMLGNPLGAYGLEWLSIDFLYFILIFTLWSLLYFRFFGEIRGASEKEPDNLTFSRAGKLEKVRLSDIVCVTANGDYADFHTKTATYLKKETLAALEADLKSKTFVRVHRSALVNSAHVASVAAIGKGRYDITLHGGRVVQSSKRYEEVVQSIIPTAQ